jgi:hypothetical protein
VTVIILVYIALGLFFIILLFTIFKKISPLIQNNSNNSGGIIKPYGIHTDTDRLKLLLEKKNIRYEEVSESSSSGSIIIQITEGPKVYFSKSREADFQISSLQLILARLTIDDRKVTLIDLRGAKPIVKFNRL